MSRRRRLYAVLLTGGLLSAAPWAATQALFTDSQAVNANTFTTGTVDISTSPTTALITYATMAPGDTVTNPMVVTNAGNLALRYSVSSTATNTDSKGLKDELDLTVKTADVDGGCDDFDGTELYANDLDGSDGKILGDVAQGSQSGDRTLAASASETLCFRAALPSATGNTFQGATTTATFT
ncbi:MAG: TasA family protein, partial [Actinomycetota bacterium]